MPQNRIVHFEIPVDELEKQSKFYSDAFGWKFQKMPMPQGGGGEYWLISTGPEGRSIGGGMYKREDPKEGVRVYVSDRDLDGAIERFKAAGGNVVNTFDIPGIVKGALGTDPENNFVGIILEQGARGGGGQRGQRGRSSSRRGGGRSSSRHSSKSAGGRGKKKSFSSSSRRRR